MGMGSHHLNYTTASSLQFYLKSLVSNGNAKKVKNTNNHLPLVELFARIISIALYLFLIVWPCHD
jgi:hypothetical protein